MAGRRSKLTPPRKKAILLALSHPGCTLRMAAEYAGVDRSTLHHWLARGRAGVPAYAEFAEAVAHTEAISAIGSLGKILKAGEQDWRALAWLLEKRYPYEFGVKVGEDPDAVTSEALQASQEARMGALDKAREQLAKIKARHAQYQGEGVE